MLRCLELFFLQNNYGNGQNTWDWLDDAVVNSRGFIPPGEFLVDKVSKIGVPVHGVATEARSRSAIWHWHGYKANQIRYYLYALKNHPHQQQQHLFNPALQLPPRILDQVFIRPNQGWFVGCDQKHGYGPETKRRSGVPSCNRQRKVQHGPSWMLPCDIRVDA